jgi:hypothetical protein
MGDEDAPGSQPTRRRSDSVSDQEFAAAGADSEAEEDSDHHSIDVRELAGMNNFTETYRSPTKGLLSTSVLSNSAKKVKSSHQKTSGVPNSRHSLQKSHIRKEQATAVGKPGQKTRNHRPKPNAEEVLQHFDSSTNHVKVGMYAYPEKFILNRLPASSLDKPYRKRKLTGHRSRSASPSGSSLFKAYVRPRQKIPTRPLQASAFAVRSARGYSDFQDDDT